MSDKWYIQSINILSNTNSMWRNSNRNMDSNRCMRKNDCICIKNDNSYSGCIANDDSTGKHNGSMRSDTGSKYNNIYQWINSTMIDNRHIQSINILSNTNSMWRKNRKSVENGKSIDNSDHSSIKNNNSNSGCIASDDSTGKHNSSMRSNTGSKYNNIYQWINSAMFDNRHIQSINILSNTNSMWRNSNRNMDSNR